MLTSSQSKQLVRLLGKCTPGDLTEDVFEAVGRVAVYPAVEIIPVRMTERGVEVLLLRRPANDITWPSMMHTPGTILRPTDENISTALARVMTEELSSTEVMKEPQFMRTKMYNHKRGRGLGVEYMLEVSNSTDGEFYSLSDLPDDMISEQVPTIKYIAEVYSAALVKGE